MAAVDATQTWVDHEHQGTPGIECRACLSEALRIFAALFARAGIEGAGTIALTRDAEGRVGLGTMERAWPDVAWARSLGQVVPVEDDEEGRE